MTVRPDPSAHAEGGGAHVYHLSWGRLLPLPLIWAVFASLLLTVAFSAPAGADHERNAMLLTTAITTLIMAPFVWITWSSRLVLTAEGIAHHQFGYTVRSTWLNVEALSLDPGREGLYLREPGTRSVLLRLSAKLIGEHPALAEGRLIMLSPFMQHWRRGSLREDILRHAPQLAAQAPPSAA